MTTSRPKRSLISSRATQARAGNFLPRLLWLALTVSLVATGCSCTGDPAAPPASVRPLVDNITFYFDDTRPRPSIDMQAAAAASLLGAPPEILVRRTTTIGAMVSLGGSVLTAAHLLSDNDGVFTGHVRLGNQRTRMFRIVAQGRPRAAADTDNHDSWYDSYAQDWALLAPVESNQPEVPQQQVVRFGPAVVAGETVWIVLPSSPNRHTARSPVRATVPEITLRDGTASVRLPSVSVFAVRFAPEDVVGPGDSGAPVVRLRDDGDVELIGILLGGIADSSDGRFLPLCVRPPFFDTGLPAEGGAPRVPD